MTEFIESSGSRSSGSCETSSCSSPYVDCWISFGGNVGDVKATFDAALALLSLHCHIRLGRRSGLYSTSPMGSQAGSPFLNSVCELSTSLCPRKLLKVLQSVETQLGRIRDIRWGPRTLDLDLLSYGNQIVSDTDLVVPHPALTYRRFVLDPLIEIDPQWRHPQFATSADRLLANLNPRPLKIAVPGVSVDDLHKLNSQLTDRFPDLKLVSETDCNETLRIQTSHAFVDTQVAYVDLRRTPGDLLEQLTSALTAIFDAPERISDW